jgi:hypothetical protein
VNTETVARYILIAVGVALLLLVTAKLVLVTAILVQLIVLVGVAVYLSKRFDAMRADLEDEVTAGLQEIRSDMAALRDEVREVRELRGSSKSHTRPARPVAARPQPGPAPVSAIFREWK